MRLKSKRKIVWEKTWGRCWYCGRKLTFDGSTIKLHTYTMDHAESKANGGANTTDNLIPACFGCNAQKGKKSLEAYRTWMSWQSVGCSPFSLDQIDYLEQNGIEIPIPPRHLFWAEMEDGDG